MTAVLSCPACLSLRAVTRRAVAPARPRPSFQTRMIIIGSSRFPYSTTNKDNSASTLEQDTQMPHIQTEIPETTQDIPTNTTSPLGEVPDEKTSFSQSETSSGSSTSAAETAADTDSITASPSNSSTSTKSSQSAPPGRSPASFPNAQTFEQTKQLALVRLNQFKLKAIEKIHQRQLELNKTFNEAGTRISTVTGYGEIEGLKTEVVKNEIELMEARAAAREAKDAHASALNERMVSGREVNDLLQRKNAWLQSDVLKFTELVQQDHVNEQKEKDFKIDVDRKEELVEKKIDELMKSILRRYHEEQIWSDKIRSLSTYGSLAITSINVLIFLLALVFVEPYKRKKMVKEVETRIKQHDAEAGEKVSLQIEGLKGLIIAQQALAPSEAAASESGHQESVVASENNVALSTDDSEEVQDLKDRRAMISAAPEIFFPGEEDCDDTEGPVEPVIIPTEGVLVDASDNNTSPADTLSISPRQREEKYKRDLVFVGIAGALIGSTIATFLNTLFG